MPRPSHECRQMIRDLRAAFYQKSYNEQNYVLLGLMEVRVCPTGRRTITYRVPTLGAVCRGDLKPFKYVTDSPAKTPSYNEQNYVLKKLERVPTLGGGGGTGGTGG